MTGYEIRQAVRALFRSPRVTATIVITLAVAVGGAGGMFSLLNAIVLRQLPVPAPERLVSVYPANGEAMLGIPGATLDELGKRQTVFEGICGFSRGSAMVDAGHGILRRPHESVGASCGHLLGVRTTLGRFIDASDQADSIEAAPVAVISAAYWRSEFAADPAIVGTLVRVQGVATTVIGVLAPNAYGMNADQQPDVVTPLGLSPRLYGGPRVIAINAFGRLMPGATIDSARAELRTLWPAVWDATNAPAPGRRLSPARSADLLRIEPFGGGLSELRDRYRESLYLLVGLAMLLLALAVVNTGGVLVARAIRRQPQLAIQLSLGAGYRRLATQLTFEGLFLAGLAGALSLPIAWWTSRALAITLWTSSLPLTMSVEPDRRTLTAIALVAFGTGLLVNLPAIGLLRQAPAVLQAGATRTAFAATSRWRRAIIVGQIALSVVLICAAALFARSLAAIRGMNVGFQSAGLYAVAVDLLPGATRDIDHAAYFAEVERRLMATPGISDVSFSGRFPLSAVREVTSLLPNYRNASLPTGSEIPTSAEHVAPDFFAMLGIPIQQGRAFTTDDAVGHPGVAIINVALAERLFPNGDAVGGRIMSVVAAQPLTVVGIVSNATRGDPRITNAPTVYLPALQEPARAMAPVVLIRANRNQDLAGVLRAAIGPLGRHTIAFIRSVEEQVDRHLARERVLSYLSAVAAGLGLLVGALGLFGLLAYAVNARTRELGLRMALGGTARDLTRMIVSEGMMLVAVGVAMGLPAAYGVGRIASSLLFSISPSDPVSLLGTTALILTVGVAACVMPTLRIARISPAEALRQD